MLAGNGPSRESDADPGAADSRAHKGKAVTGLWCRVVRVAPCVEPTNWHYADFNFVRGFPDAVTFARATGLRVCLDRFRAWAEGGLRAGIASWLSASSRKVSSSTSNFDGHQR